MDEKTNVIAHPRRREALTNLQMHKLHQLALDRPMAVAKIESVIANLKTLACDLNSSLVREMIVEFRNAQLQIEALDLKNLPDPERFFEFADRLNQLNLKWQEC